MDAWTDIQTVRHCFDPFEFQEHQATPASFWSFYIFNDILCLSVLVSVSISIILWRVMVSNGEESRGEVEGYLVAQCALNLTFKSESVAYKLV
jgi:hypothetical protein